MKVKREDHQEQATILKGSKAAGSTDPGRRAIILVALAAVVLIAAVVGVVAASRPSGSAPARSAVFAFKPQSFASGLIVDRTWTLSGVQGNHLEGSATLTNGKTGDISTNYDLVLPRSVAPNVKRVSFSPPPERVIQPDPVVGYSVALTAGALEKIGFSVDVGPTQGNRSVRLRQLAEAQESAEASYLESTHQAAPTTLKTLQISPSTLDLIAGQSHQVTLSGTMSNGSPSTATALAGVTWNSSAPAWPQPRLALFMD